MTLRLTSDAFENAQPLPAKHTCDGQNVSPPLRWTAGPAKTQGYALVVNDVDARGDFVHWVVSGIPAGQTALAEGVGASESAGSGLVQGKNGFGKQGYGGPCPPKGKAHRYRFHLFALDQQPGLKPGMTANDLRRAINEHVLDQGELVGTHQR